jgi:methyltransferase (TIGR00027 family)
MKAKEPSGSAIVAAITRAAHLFIDDEPKIFHDDFALGFSGMQNETTLKSNLDMFRSGMARQTSPEYASSFYISYRAFALIRHRYTEDKLEKATERGISQYVILGAGLDSFAYRRQDMKDRLRVFEVDHPSSQEWKKRKLEELKIPVPGNLTFVPVDFEQQQLMDELYHHDFKKGSTAFFSWLGVTIPDRRGHISGSKRCSLYGTGERDNLRVRSTGNSARTWRPANRSWWQKPPY